MGPLWAWWLLDPHGHMFPCKREYTGGMQVRERGGEREEEMEGEREGEVGRERASLFPWGYNQELFQNKQSTSQAFIGF